MRNLRLATSVFAVVCLVVPAATATVGDLPDGQYELNVFSGANRITYSIIKIETKEGKPLGEVTAASPQFGTVTLTALTRTADDLRFNMTIRSRAGQTTVAQFAGSAGDASGSRGVFSYLGRTLPARLDPTENVAVTGQNEPLPEQRELAAIIADKDQAARTKKLQKFVADHADSPFVFEAYRLIIASAKQAGLDGMAVANAAEGYAAKAAAWNPKWHQETLLSIAASLTQAEMLPELSLKYIEEVQKQMGRNVNAASLRTIELTFAQAFLQLNRFDEAEKALKKLHERVPTDQQAAFLLGQVQEKSGNLDGAIETWLPIFTSRFAAEPLRKAWLKKHGNFNGFEAKLDKIYHEQVPPLDVTKFSGRQSASANGMVLMELFTGAMCPPCVAADVAFDALVDSYPGGEVVFLEYHMHIPGPDPMTNPDAETRFKYYAPDARGTPATFFNGKSEAGGGGRLANAGTKYDQYRAAINPKLEATTNGSLKLRVFGDGEAIKIETEITGLAGESKPLPENLRLRLALVEDIVRYPSSNGMWQSHKVVRAMPGGAEGVAIKKDNFTDTEVVSVADLRKSLADYVDKYEAGLADSPRPYTFPDKPFKLEHLSVVAFVQDDTTKEVLLSASASVEAQ